VTKQSPSQVDERALQSAVALARRESAECDRQVAAMLESRTWQEVAEFCSYCCQSQHLHLQPWQDPPCVIDLASALREPMGDQRALREGGELLKQMLALGISKYHPSPLDALRQAEEKAAR
jgi:hypothetical protein